MKTYRMNAVMAGALYFLGTAFGVTGRFVGGDLFSVTAKPLAGVDILGLIPPIHPSLPGWHFAPL